MVRYKQVKHQSTKTALKSTVKGKESSENLQSVWLFDRIDRAGKFSFDINRADFRPKEFLEKMINYSNMTWSEINKQTHDDGKSKHHFLRDVRKFSKEAQERVENLKLTEDTDRIFSFALTNKLRIIGLRDREFFHVLWYDPEHEIYPSEKR